MKDFPEFAFLLIALIALAVASCVTIDNGSKRVEIVQVSAPITGLPTCGMTNAQRCALDMACKKRAKSEKIA